MVDIVYWVFLLHGGQYLPRAAKSDVWRFHRLDRSDADGIPDASRLRDAADTV